jgi:hypothetical protein
MLAVRGSQADIVGSAVPKIRRILDQSDWVVTQCLNSAIVRSVIHNDDLDCESVGHLVGQKCCDATQKVLSHIPRDDDHAHVGARWVRISERGTVDGWLRHNKSVSEAANLRTYPAFSTRALRMETTIGMGLLPGSVMILSGFTRWPGDRVRLT